MAGSPAPYRAGHLRAEPGRFTGGLRPGLPSGKLITIAGVAVFVLCGLVAVLGLSAKARSVLEPRIGSAHASVVGYALILAGAITIALVALSLLNVSVGKLIVGGALTGVLIGIAAQQALGNVFMRHGADVCQAL